MSNNFGWLRLDAMAHMNRTTIAVVMPVKDEAEIIAASIAHVVEALDGHVLDFRVVCVDDGSIDATWPLLSAAAEKDSRVVAVRLARNFGHDAALFAGISTVDADAYITLDCDGQHPFFALPEMIALWRSSGCDVVNGVKQSRGDESLSYKLAVGVFGRFLSWTIGRPLNNATEFKLLSRRAAQTLLGLGDSHVFYRALVPWMGLPQCEYLFDVGESMRPGRHWHLSSLIRFALSGLVMFSDFPIRLIFGLGIVALALCLVLAAKLALAILFGDVATGYSTLLALLLLNLGFTMAGLGVIGMYVRTTLNQAIGRPRAIIQAVVAGTTHTQPNAVVL